MNDTFIQGRHWSRHAANYDEFFLDPLLPGVDNPVLSKLAAIPDAREKGVIDLGCGTGALLPQLIKSFGKVAALDFAPAMIRKARDRLGADVERVEFLARPMHDLDDLRGEFDVAVALNSVVMPDVRVIDRTLKAVRACLRPGGVFLGILPAMDAIHYHTMLIFDRELELLGNPRQAAQATARQVEHCYYDFTFGRFEFHGLRQKFWQPFEVDYRMRKAGFGKIELDRVLYPWDENVYGGAEFAEFPRSWDWAFAAHA